VGWYLVVSGTKKKTQLTFLTSLVMLLLINSSARQNNNGDSGSPCLTPLEQEKKPCNFPLIEIEIFADASI